MAGTHQQSVAAATQPEGVPGALVGGGVAQCERRRLHPAHGGSQLN